MYKKDEWRYYLCKNHSKQCCKQQYENFKEINIEINNYNNFKQSLIENLNKNPTITYTNFKKLELKLYESNKWI